MRSEVSIEYLVIYMSDISSAVLIDSGISNACCNITRLQQASLSRCFIGQSVNRFCSHPQSFGDLGWDSHRHAS